MILSLLAETYLRAQAAASLLRWRTRDGLAGTLGLDPANRNLPQLLGVASSLLVPGETGAVLEPLVDVAAWREPRGGS